ncbi:MAG: sulfatase, partial [Planctomycetota bacterium]
QFYVAASVCTPSRAGLMTGRYPVRSGMWGNRRVLFPDSVGGLPDSEVTVAECLSDAGYATGMVGKWHLGHRPEYLPTRHGFDSYVGIPYSNDMDKIPSAPRGRVVFQEPDWRHFNVPLLFGTSAEPPVEIERPVDQTTITRRYTEFATQFIREHTREPFFLYLAHSLPHVPLFRSADFVGYSRAGLYGDVIEEIDDGVGQILATLKESGLDQNTLVLFTSDNGPWLSFGDQGGSAGPLRDGKGTTFEGGMRVPAIAWMPGHIDAGTICRDLTSTLDVLPTFSAMASADLPEGLILDGFDLSATLLDGQPSPRESMFFYRGDRLMAVRHHDHKAHYITRTSYRKDSNRAERHDVPELYDLSVDIGEARNIAAKHPDVVEAIGLIKEDHQQSMVIAESQLDRK